MRDFRKLNIWMDGIVLVKEIYKIANLLPSNEKYGLKSQITRAAISIPSNIAEGCSRNSDIEFNRFLEIAIGSSFEVETQLIIMQELSFIPNEQLISIFEQLNKLQKMINSLIIKLKSKSELLKANND